MSEGVLSIAIDVTVTREGSVFTFDPMTPAAREWFNGHVPCGVVQFGDAFVCEPKDAWSLTQDIVTAGLMLNRGGRVMATISKNNNATRVPVLVDRESYNTYKAFSNETGIPVLCSSFPPENFLPQFASKDEQVN